MPRDYSWAQRNIPEGLYSIGDLAEGLDMGRHQARRILLSSGLPCWLIMKRWRGSNGKYYCRRAWAIPFETHFCLILEQLEDRKSWFLARVGIPTPPDHTRALRLFRAALCLSYGFPLSLRHTYGSLRKPRDFSYREVAELRSISPYLARALTV